MKRILMVTLILALGLSTLVFAPVQAAPPGPTLVDVAIAVNTEGPFAGQFDTLIAAVLAADPAVLKTLSGNGQFTVFAPTDDAFAALGLNPTNIGYFRPGFPYRRAALSCGARAQRLRTGAGLRPDPYVERGLLAPEWRRADR
jgi:hypothetical protein